MNSNVLFLLEICGNKHSFIHSYDCNIYGNNVLSDQQIGREIQTSGPLVMYLLMLVANTTTTIRDMTTIKGRQV